MINLFVSYLSSFHRTGVCNHVALFHHLVQPCGLHVWCRAVISLFCVWVVYYSSTQTRIYDMYI